MNRLIFYLLLLNLNAHGQVSGNEIIVKRNLSYIKNTRISYSFVLGSYDTSFPMNNSGTFVIVNLEKKKRDILKKVDKKMWLLLLNDSKYDYSANIFLYYLYKKDATILSNYSNISDWRLLLKKDDIDYWKNLFQ